MVANIEQVAQDELITHRTRDLSNTDFADPELLLSDKHFDYLKKCSASRSMQDCWKTSPNLSNVKIIYKTIVREKTSFNNSSPSVFLKNGVLLSYKLDSNDGKTIGVFRIDVNGNSKPNVWGRDAFVFYITPGGKVTDIATINNSAVSAGNCRSGNGTPAKCFSLLISNNWKMDY